MRVNSFAVSDIRYTASIIIGWLQVQVMDFFLLSLSFQTCFVQLSLRVRSHGLLVYRLCLLPDTPIIYIFNWTAEYCMVLDHMTCKKMTVSKLSILELMLIVYM